MKNRRILYVLLITVIVLCAALYGGAEYMLRVSICPPPSTYRNPQTVRDTMTRLYPDLRPWLDSLESHHALRDTAITAPDGTRLHALYVRASTPTPRIVIAVHGYQDAAGRMLHVGRMYARDFHANILLPDLRYHGSTPGEYIGMGWRDRLDVLQWANAVPGIFGVNPDSVRLAVHGISMGAATTMMLSGEQHLPPYLRAFVEDCGYTSVRDIFASVLKSDYGLPTFPLMEATEALCRRRYGWTFSEASPLESVRRCRLPMLFIHGGRDTYVPTSMVYPLYAAKPAPKALWVAPGSEHALSYRDHPVEYERRVRTFLDRYAW